jgi:hypothetical protein
LPFHENRPVYYSTRYVERCRLHRSAHARYYTTGRKRNSIDGVSSYAATGKPIFHQKVSPNTLTYGVAWSPDGKKLAVAGADNKAYLLDVP